MTLGDTIRSGTKWLFAGSLGRQLLQFFFGIALARLLVPEDFGMLVTVQIFTGIAGYLASGGMGEALVQAKEVARRDYGVVFTAQLMICILLYIFFFIIAPWFADWFDEPLYQDLLRVSALSFLIRPFANIPNAKLRREMKFNRTAVISVLSILIGSCASITLALLDMGVWSLIFGGLIGSLFGAIALIFVSNWYPFIAIDISIARRLGGYGIKFSINDIIIYLKTQSSNFIISQLMGPAMVGLYNKASSLAQMPGQIILGSLYQPVFRGLATVQEDKSQSKYIFLRTITLITVYVTPVYLALWWLADPFIIFVYGEKWRGSIESLEILALTGLFLWGGPCGAVIAAQNQLGREIWITLETWATLLAFLAIGYKWGLVGIAWATILNTVYSSIRLYSLAKKTVSATYRDLILAVKPGYILNALLFIILLISDRIYLSLFKDEYPVIYMAGIVSIGFVTYIMLVFCMPFAELATEVSRWKRYLHNRLARTTRG